MEQNQDIAVPDQDTHALPSLPPTPPSATDAPRDDAPSADIEQAETARIPTIAANPASVPAPADAPTLANAVVAAGADDVAEAPTQRVPVPTNEPTAATTEAPTQRVPTVPTLTATSQAQSPRYPWLRYPEFWLALALAAFLRLWHLDLTSFLFDQSSLMRLARGAWLQHALPVTGIPSSIGTLNPPISVYLLMPFTLFGRDPLPAAIAIALWNVAGVALCYIFAQRYFGRVIAAAGTLLFATCGEAVNFSRFIWQQNLLPPVLALWLLTLYLGCIRGQRRWFAAHAVLLTIAILLHTTTAFLIPVSLVALALTPRRALPSRREIALATAIILVLLTPTVLWEAVSRGYDLHIFARYFTHGSALNLDVFRMLYAALGAPSLGEFGPGTLYSQLGVWATVINVGMALCFVAGLAVLTERLLRVGIHIWRAGTPPATDASRMARLRIGSLAVWHGLRAEPIWRAHLLLWLAVVVPPVLMLRHASPLYIHYLIVLYPTAFIVSGFAFQAAFRLAGRLASHASLVNQVARASILTALTVLVLTQAFQSALFPATLASGKFDAFLSYGYPLAEVQQLDTALGTLQAEQDTHATFLSLPQAARYRDAYDYLMVGERPDRIGSAANCLVLPAPDQEPALIAAIPPTGPASALITSLPELTPVANLAMTGSGDVTVYQMDGKLPPLLGERPLTPISFADAAGNGLRLDAVAVQPDGQLRLRWTVLGSATTSVGTPWYHIAPSVRTANGKTMTLPATDCQPTRWHAGETVFTWATPGKGVDTQTLMLQLTASITKPTVKAGPVHVLAGSVQNTPPKVLRPPSGSTGTTGTVSAYGTFSLPLSDTP